MRDIVVQPELAFGLQEQNANGRKLLGELSNIERRPRLKQSLFRYICPSIGLSVNYSTALDYQSHPVELVVVIYRITER